MFQARVAILAGVAVLALCGAALYAALADYTAHPPVANARVPQGVSSTPATTPAIAPEATAPTTTAPQSPPTAAPATPAGQPAQPDTRTDRTAPLPFPTFVPIPRPTHHRPGPLPPIP